MIKLCFEGFAYSSLPSRAMYLANDICESVAHGKTFMFTDELEIVYSFKGNFHFVIEAKINRAVSNLAETLLLGLS